jgi:hypothetical protein
MTTATATPVRSMPAHLGECGFLIRDGKSVEDFATLGILRPLFVELWWIYDNYLTNTNFEDLPWWYTERMIVGHLTAAAARAGLTAAEEFQLLKGKANESAPQKKGRADWWVATPGGECDIWAEAKQVFVAASGGWNPFRTKMSEAYKEIQTTPIEQWKHTRKLAVVFARPIYREDEDHEESRECFLNGEFYPPDVDYLAYYWLHEQHLESCLWDGYYYPGLLICCREVRGD